MEKREVVISKADEAMKNKERGASLVEYGILVALIAAIAIGTVTTLGTRVNRAFNNIAQQNATIE